MPRLPCPLPVLVLSASACHITLHDDVVVDGVRLPAHHEEVLTLDSWPAEGLVLHAHRGDVRVERGEGPTTLTVVVYEREPGEAHVHVVDGRLVARAVGGAKCAIGDVLVRTSGPAAGLEIETGMGDVELRDVLVEGRLSMGTGMGDVNVSGAGEPDTVVLSSGMGSVSVSALRCARLSAETGMGDVNVDGLEADQLEVSSGMGDVEVERSRGSRIAASSGMGEDRKSVV